jgi:transcriptional regulator with XRE-family HTH domain
MEFKDRLRALREDKPKSAAQLAGLFEKSEGAVRMWETGRSKPDVDTLVRLAEYFECSTDYLLGLSDFKNEKKLETVNALLMEAARLFLEVDTSVGEYFILTLISMLRNSIAIKDHAKHFYGDIDADHMIQIDVLQSMNSVFSCFWQLMSAEPEDIDKLYINFIFEYEKTESELREYRSLLITDLIHRAKSNKYIIENILKIDDENFMNFPDEKDASPENPTTKPQKE